MQWILISLIGAMGFVADMGTGTTGGSGSTGVGSGTTGAESPKTGVESGLPPMQHLRDPRFEQSNHKAHKPPTTKPPHTPNSQTTSP
jgi:hypothetical protein